jgi:SNF2 family DNA or RNA helicase
MSSTTKENLTLLSPSLLSENQELCLTRLFETDATLVVAEMGFGKTVVTLSAIKELIDDGVITRVLILAPLKVINTLVWQKDIAKWSQLQGLTITAATGIPEERVNAIKSSAQIVLMNYENVPWFCDTFKSKHTFDGLVCDEITKLKSNGSRGYKKLRHRAKDFVWRVGLSGTPVSEDFESLFSMTYILDMGERFGGKKDAFLKKYFYPTDYKQRNWELLDETGAALLSKMADLVFLADNAAYTKTLPPISYHTELVTLPDHARDIYETMKEDAVVGDISADNAAVVVGKLLQIASGFMYGDDKLGIPLELIHDCKLRAVHDLVRSLHAPVVIAYWFKHDFELLKANFPHAGVLGGTNDQRTIEAWNSGRLEVLLLQPRSAGHGIQLQGGGSNIIWYGPVWSRDLVLQTNARLHRQGQKDAVNVYTVIADDTIDGDVMDRVENKGGYAELLAAYLG